MFVSSVGDISIFRFMFSGFRLRYLFRFLSSTFQDKMSLVLYFGDDKRSLEKFLGAMDAKRQAAGPGTVDHPKGQLFWFYDVESRLEGSARNFYLSVRNKILAMKREYPERPALAAVQYRHSIPPVLDAAHNVIAPGQPERLAEPRVEWRAAGLYTTISFVN